MNDLSEAFRAIVELLERQDVEYAVCWRDVIARPRKAHTARQSGRLAMTPKLTVRREK